MRITSGLLLGLWLLFLWVKMAGTTPTTTDGDLIQMVTAIVLVVQSIGWAFSFTKPAVTLTVLLFTGCLCLVLALVFSSVYWILAVSSLLLAGICATGLKSVKKAAA